jgi:hypothetical protein
MAGTMVVYKRTRAAKSTAWYHPASNLMVAFTAENIACYGGLSESADGLTQIRTIYFPATADYTAWQASAGQAAISQARVAYNTANGITEVQEVVNFTTV